MGLLFIFFIVIVGSLILIFKFIIWYTNKSVSVLVDSKHRDADYIISSRLAPPEWKSRLPVRFGSYFAKNYAIGRLKSITNYFKHTPLIESEEARKAAIDDLQSIREEWRQVSWNEIYPYQ